MKTASIDLIHEHKAILIALNVIEKIVERIQNNEEIDPKDIEDLIEFLKVFADKCHHGKEEGFLFPALEKIGIKNENGPIGVMLAQHNQGRNLIKQMQESITDQKINKNAFIVAGTEYVKLLRSHIEKEDTILFPLSDARLSVSEQKQLLIDFENLEENVIGKGTHEELHALLGKFKNKYLN
jgi:hemerythrin-like domain-containing protein